MSATAALFALLCAWLVIGIMSCFVMTRRGHDPWSWGVLGALLGPLVIPLALAATRRDRETSRLVETWHTGQVGRGPISALVGVDGSVEAAAAACTVIELFGPRLGHLTLGTVTDLEAAASASAARAGIELGGTSDARTPRDVCRRFRSRHDPARRENQPHALLDYALDHDIDLLAVGSHGRGLSKAVLGSVAARLVQQQDVPVLVVGSGMPRSTRTTFRSAGDRSRR